jgi:hypothetical protein
MDAKKINQKLKGEADRKATTLHLSQVIFQEFKEVCSPYSASRVIEEMMKEYIESLKTPKKSTAKSRKTSVKKN